MKLNYNKNLDFVEKGFRACWQNAMDLLASARLLLDAKKVGVSLSVSVLTMEEIGKMMFIDGLLLAQSNDYKNKNFKSGFGKHQSKLKFLELFPLFVQALAKADSRCETPPFKEAIGICLEGLERERAVLAIYMNGETDLTFLDSWKQKGFYVDDYNGTFMTPNEVISEDFALAVHTVAWRITTFIDFLLRDGNIERYFENARKIRSRMSENEWRRIEAESDEVLKNFI